MHLTAAAVAAALASGCSARPAVEQRARFESAPLPAVGLRLLLQPEHQQDGERYRRAAESTLKTYGEWLGPYPAASLTLIDPGWRDESVAVEGAIRMDRTPWRSAGTSMAPELAAARAISRRFWRERVDTTNLPPWFVEGLAEYGARRSVA